MEKFSKIQDTKDLSGSWDDYEDEEYLSSDDPSLFTPSNSDESYEDLEDEEEEEEEGKNEEYKEPEDSYWTRLTGTDDVIIPEEPFTSPSGLKRYFNDFNKPISFFELFLSPNFLQMICNVTNSYVKSKLAKNKRRRDSHKKSGKP